MKKIYVATPLKLKKFEFDLIQRQIRSHDVFAFIPLPQPKLPIEKCIMVNKHHIEKCDEVWVFGVYGRDVAWEIGYAQALGKKIVVFQTKKNLKNVKDDEMMFSRQIEIREVT